ncbi:very short patch repair endonuclease [Niabella yanshanensis]|uniref:Very short patch repair endonuclease n=1 Tax=Niabella yanshanensis TaxID=577386 RepID=A0ABZ0WA86_9BACT|nr:very short patch repair endonuclease [Niabella yanshanensis]WQD39060.1 very short patch repair endonuclease [Niabella yanshanensis]
MSEKKYIRDKRSPHPSSEGASHIMSSIKAKNTKPELIVRKLLWQKGYKGYRLHPTIPGKPDIVFLKKKVAVFVNGCYWHRCPHCNLPMPRSNTEFWAEKFHKNVARDNKKREELEQANWKVLVLWECEIKKQPEIEVEKIIALLETY